MRCEIERITECITSLKAKVEDNERKIDRLWAILIVLLISNGVENAESLVQLSTNLSPNLQSLTNIISKE